MGFEIICECGGAKENIFMDDCFSCEIFKTLKRKDKPTSFICFKCFKSYNCASSRTRHMQTHDAHKKFKCTVKGCGISCYDSSKMKLHLNTHASKKDYNCKYCPTKFSTRWNLGVHLKRFHYKQNINVA